MIRILHIIFWLSFSLFMGAQETVLKQPNWFISGGIDTELSVSENSKFQTLKFDFSLLAGKQIGDHWSLGLNFAWLRNTILDNFRKTDIQGFIDDKSEFELGVFGRYQTSMINHVGMYIEPSVGIMQGFTSSLAFGLNYRINEKFQFSLQLLQIKLLRNKEKGNNNQHNFRSLDFGFQKSHFSLKGVYYLLNKKRPINNKLNWTKYIFLGGDLSYHKDSGEINFYKSSLVSYVGLDFLKHWGGGIIFQRTRYEWNNEFDSSFLKTKYQGFGIFVRLQKRFERIHLFLQSSVMFNKSISESMNANVVHSNGEILNVTFSPNISYHLFKNLFLNISPGYLSYEELKFENIGFSSENSIALNFGLQHLKIGLELKFKQIASFQK